ncbi:MAG: type II toxin-antitoxin system prevent-host-death family antitoxin [Rhodospirillales bacterium]
MITVGAFEAKTQFSALLERVARGEEIVITKHGKPIARLVPEQAIDRQRVAETIKKIKDLSKECRLGGLSVRELREEGRK